MYIVIQSLVVRVWLCYHILGPWTVFWWLFLISDTQKILRYPIIKIDRYILYVFDIVQRNWVRFTSISFFVKMHQAFLCFWCLEIHVNTIQSRSQQRLGKNQMVNPFELSNFIQCCYFFFVWTELLLHYSKAESTFWNVLQAGFVY